MDLSQNNLNQTYIREFLLKIDTSDAIPLSFVPSQASSSQSNTSTIMYDNTNSIKFKFNRLIKNIIYIEVEEFIVPSLEYLVPTKYLIPDIQDSVTDTFNGKNKAGDLPWQMTPLNYFCTYTGNALAQYGYLSSVTVTPDSSSATIASQGSRGDRLTGALSSANAVVMSTYVNSDASIQKVFYRTINQKNFIQNENIDIAGGNTWITTSGCILSRDDQIRQSLVAFNNNQLLPGFQTFPPENINGSVIITNANYYNTTTVSSDAWNVVGATFSSNVMTLQTKAPHFFQTDDTVCLTGSSNSVLSGCYTVAAQDTVTYGITAPLYFSVQLNTALAGGEAAYWNAVASQVTANGKFLNEDITSSFNDMQRRMAQDFKNHQIVIKIPELGNFYEPRINTKQGKNFLPAMASLEQNLSTRTYEIEQSSYYGFRKSFSTPLTLNSLTLNLFTNEGKKLLINDTLFGALGEKKNKISITMKIRVLEEI